MPLLTRQSTTSSPLTLFETRLHADPSRVVLRPFHLGWQAHNAPHGRALKLVSDVAAMDEASVLAEYERVLHDFQERHWQTETMFAERYAELCESLHLHEAEFSETRKRLIGAYFCHEYTYAAAALMNPSIVPHPDQSGMGEDAVRFVMSLRAVGEGHISSIVFREGIACNDGTFSLWPQSAFATAVALEDASLSDANCGVIVSRHAETNLSNTVMARAITNGSAPIPPIQAPRSVRNCWARAISAASCSNRSKARPAATRAWRFFRSRSTATMPWLAGRTARTCFSCSRTGWTAGTTTVAC